MPDVKGILGTKLGMTQIFDDTRAIPVTVLKAGPCIVAQLKTEEADGYNAVQLAFGEVPARKVSKPMRGHFDKADAEPQRHVVELRTDDVAEYTLGQVISADVFAAGDRADVVGVSKGKGFAGVMKRHGFKRPVEQPRHAAQASLARRDRRVRDAEPRVQGHADGRPDGQRARHGPEPRDRPGRRRARAAPDPRRGARPRRRPRDGPLAPRRTRSPKGGAR